jgi:hypothetical protein
MPACKKCNNNFPNRIVLEGKEHNLNSRKFCLTCSPFNSKNTKNLCKFDITPKDKQIGDRRFLLPCNICKKEKILRSINAICFACAITKRRKEIKQKAIDYKGSKCQICGYDKCNRALCFHHLDPSKKDFSITSTVKSWKKIRDELDKCIMLCHNCHAEEHDKIENNR